MALLEQTVTASVANPGAARKVFAVQSDTGRIIYCAIDDWDIPDGSAAKALARLPSGTVVEGDCEIDGNTVAFALTAEILAENGKAAFCIEITSGSEMVTTFQVDLVVGQKDC